MTFDVAGELAAAVLPDGREVSVRLVDASDAAVVLDVITASFRARPVVGREPEALSDDLASIRARLAHGHGYLALVDGQPAGLVMAARQRAVMRLGRVGVLPEFREQGLASFLVGIVLEHLAVEGHDQVSLLARMEYPHLQRWWARHGFSPVGEEGNCLVLTRDLPVAIDVPDAVSMQALGERLAGLLRAGDLLIASGDLGAGKTTLAQGIGAGLQVQGPITSPTFVLARIHPPEGSGPALVHVDAYRLGSIAELEDIDLETSLGDSVTLVEWGEGLADGLAEERLLIDIRRGLDPDDDTRWVFFTGIGARWDRARLAAVLEERA